MINLLNKIGKTPMVKLDRAKLNTTSDIFVKLEYMNPSGSMKDRIALSMIRDFEKKNIINSNTHIIEPTSGNTGISLAMVCAILGYKLTLTMPENASEERKKIQKLYGATVVLTPKSLGFAGAIEEAKKLQKITPNSVVLNQYFNESNYTIHHKTTAREIWKDVKGQIDYFIAGIGTGGLISGVGKYCKQRNPNVQIIGIEPNKNNILSQGKSFEPHAIQGIGPNFMPGNLKSQYIDKIVNIDEKDAIKYMKLLCLNGIACGISTGASMAQAMTIAQNKIDKNIIIVAASNIERYLSCEFLKDDFNLQD